MLQIAKVLKSNGTDGGILIGTRGIAIEEIDLTEPVFIEFDGLPVPFFIESLVRKGTDKAIVHITGVISLKDAEEVVGKAIFADYFEEEEDGEDFTGWKVFDKERLVGTVTGLEDIPGNPCLCIGENLIPLHDDFILEVNSQRKELVLELPDGLL